LGRPNYIIKFKVSVPNTNEFIIIPIVFFPRNHNIHGTWIANGNGDHLIFHESCSFSEDGVTRLQKLINGEVLKSYAIETMTPSDDSKTIYNPFVKQDYKTSYNQTMEEDDVNGSGPYNVELYRK
jgi:hypothetical protein